MMKLLATSLTAAFLSFLLPLAVLAQSGEPQSLPASPLTIVTSRGQTFEFEVEVALTPGQQSIGLMFREEMAADAGMLFVFDRVRPASFWMRNTLIPLDMLFVLPDGTIESIAQRTTPLSEASVSSIGPVAAVLELNGGLTALLGIRTGDRVVHEALGNAD